VSCNARCTRRPLAAPAASFQAAKYGRSGKRRQNTFTHMMPKLQLSISARMHEECVKQKLGRQNQRHPCVEHSSSQWSFLSGCGTRKYLVQQHVHHIGQRPKGRGPLVWCWQRRPDSELFRRRQQKPTTTGRRGCALLQSHSS
jgi:hypothetical protein